MPSSPSTIFILFLVALGFLVGAGLATWLANQKKAGKPGDQVLPARPREASGLNPTYFEEIVSLWRRRADNQLIVVQDGKQVEAASLVPEAKRKLWEQATREWLVWLGLLPARPAGLQPPLTEKSPAPMPAPLQAPADSPAIIPSAVREIPPAAEKNKNLSIVQQVNEILQEALRHSGQSQRGISLVEDPVKGVVVFVGVQRFEGIDAVTDLEVRSLIKEAVKEWERRTEIGK